MSEITPSQTVGPFFKYALTPGSDYQWNDAFSNDLVKPDVSGERIRIVGQVFDGNGRAIPDSMLEIWQADAQGRFADPVEVRAIPNTAFKGFGRCGTDINGGFLFHTIRPGSLPGPGGRPQAPHILLAIFARGMTQQAITRIYFEDQDAANAVDPILALVPADRRATLIARCGQGDVTIYRFDIYLQGDSETVFFDI